ncbi:hypothetical protein [Metamycoplasma neophronis]|uniref:DUF4293 family protein n=1 Tax=Metamycoplasma neophronis TaxID=872983 RepID=A0ABY2Z0D3_9BACT|nr:hypothetical protein [Metamycoplasma neophronis]TPR54341.1 hypothetical protein FJR74_01020 [Metamycoplasma neophronis]
MCKNKINIYKRSSIINWLSFSVILCTLAIFLPVFGLIFRESNVQPLLNWNILSLVLLVVLSAAMLWNYIIVLKNKSYKTNLVKITTIVLISSFALTLVLSILSFILLKTKAWVNISLVYRVIFSINLVYLLIYSIIFEVKFRKDINQRILQN